MRKKYKRRRIGERRTTYTGRIIYNRSRRHPFDLHRVVRICTALIGNDRESPQSAPSIQHLWYLFTEWMSRRGLFRAAHAKGILQDHINSVERHPAGTDSWQSAYIDFIKWFDTVVSGVQTGTTLLKKLMPELTPYINLVENVSTLYGIVREHFPIE